MEQWQRDHILKHLVELIKSTTINTHLIASLKAKKILSDTEAEAIEHQILIPSEKSRKLYEILPTKTRSFEVLIQTLDETRQSGAAKILKGHATKFRNYGLISVDENHVLGNGATSKVFKGKFEDRDVAVKVLHTNLVDVDIITREVEFLKKLDSHENILRYFLAESHETCIYIALELCVISLQDEVNIKLLQIDPNSLLLECTKGLNHLHNHNVVHRDLKPANILLNARKQVKIADFGFSKQIPIGMSSITVHSGGFGTVDWMAPEILEYLQQGMAKSDTLKMSKLADIFSLGCIFYFTLSDGLHPFGNSFEILYNISQYNPKITDGKISAEWNELIARMISRSPKARPNTNDILNSKCFASSTKLHVQSDTPNISQDFQTKNKDHHPTAQRSASQTVDKNTHGLTAALNSQTKQFFSRNQSQSKTISPIIAEKQRAFTTNTDFFEFNSQPSERSTTVGATATVAKRVHQDSSSRLRGSDEKNILEEKPSVSTTPEVEKSLKICNQMLQGKKYKNRGLTLLHMAVILEDKATVEHLISKGADVNKRNKRGETPLQWSCRSDNCIKKIFPILIKNGADVNFFDWNDWDKLLRAVEWVKSQETLKAMVRVRYKGETLMNAAVAGGNVEALKYFISLGLDMNSRNFWGNPPLHCIVHAKVNFVETLNVLLANGAGINAVDNLGHSTLHLAAKEGCSKEKLEALVRAGADVNLKDKEGGTVMRFAVWGGNVEAVEYFILLGLSIHERDRYGRTPIHLLRDIYAEKNFEDILNVLLKHGADINSRDSFGETLLIHLVVNKKPKEKIDLVKRLGGTK